MFGYLDNNLNGLHDPSYQMHDQLGEVMTSADFTYAIQEFVQRLMIPGYSRKRFEFEPLVKPETLPNFLDVTRYQRRAGMEDLEYLGEKGSPRAGSIPDATPRRFHVCQWDKQLDFSMKTLVNDDLGYIEDGARSAGEAARRTLEKFVSRFYTNAVTIARLTFLGALYQINGRLTSARISTARMAFNQRVDVRGEPITATLAYVVYHRGLVDTVRTIRASQLVPELATNAVNVVAGDFIPIQDPYIVGVAPNLPWHAFVNWRDDNIVPFVLARRAGVPAPLLIRKQTDKVIVTSLLDAGTLAPPVMGDFATGNIEIQIYDEWGTYIDPGDTSHSGNMFDDRGCFYSSGTAP